MENATARNSNDGMSVGYHAVSHYSSHVQSTGLPAAGRAGNDQLRQSPVSALLRGYLRARCHPGRALCFFDTEERRPGMADTGAGSGDTKVYRNENALPLAYFADTAALSALPEEGSPLPGRTPCSASLRGRRTYHILKACRLPPPSPAGSPRRTGG